MSLFLACLLAAGTPDGRLDEAARVLRLGRAEQSREMIRMAIAQGASGTKVDRILADLAFAEKRWAEATARYDQLLFQGHSDAPLLEQAGIAALENGRIEEATGLLDRATRSPGAGWRAWNARGVAADRQGDWEGADRFYAAGLRLDPASATLRNNLGWSLLLRGRWAEARDQLVQAALADPANVRIIANRDLAEAAVDEDLPQRRAGESNEAFAARLNDAGVIALRQGKESKAAAAFARAIEAHGRWFTRAANNLALVDAP